MAPIWRPLWGEIPESSDTAVSTPDVIVIGAGIAGCTAALELQRAGKQVLLLEGRYAGTGTTGRTTAKVTAGHAAIYNVLIESVGLDAAAAYATAQHTALQYFYQRGDSPGVEQLDHHVFWDSDDPLIHQELAAVRAAGLNAEIQSADLPAAVMSLTYPNQFQIDPRAWLQHLLAEFRSLGGSMLVNTRVVDVDDGDMVRVKTATDEYQTQDVVVATHFPISHQILGAPRLSTQMAFVVAGPSSLEVDGTWISADDSLSVRWANDAGERILVISGEPHRNGEVDTAEAYHRLGVLAQERFGLEELRYFWSAHDLHTEDKLPYIGLQLPTSKHVWVASGFGSWGMTNGTFAGLMLSELITTGSHPLEQHFDPRRIGFVPPVSQVIRESGEAIKHLVGERITHVVGGNAEELTPGQGCVIREGADFVAVHRNTDGELVRVSAACTHLGCLVSWNQGDQTWDCPCHGSRFQATGEVLEGPATEPLSGREKHRQTAD